MAGPLNREQPTIRDIADASYRAYLMHLPLLVNYHLMMRSTFLSHWPTGSGALHNPPRELSLNA